MRRRRGARARRGLRAAVVALPLVLAGCSAPTVNIATPEPLAVDVTLRVDIYQHASAEPQEPTVAAEAAAGEASVESRRRARMGEIQTLKNSRLVGENRYGLLSVLEQPAGDYGARTKRIVEAENADRKALMIKLAAERRVPLATIESEQATLWRDRAFVGEWVEEPQSDGGWKWVQKRAGEGEEAPAAGVVPPESGAVAPASGTPAPGR